MNRRLFFKDLILFSLIVGILFIPLFLGIIKYNTYDVGNEYIYFYQNMRNNLFSGNLAFWDHNYFLGNNILGAQPFYTLGDPFCWVAVVLRFFTIYQALVFVHALKIIVGFSLFYYLLSLFNLKRNTIRIYSFIYCFSSFALVYFGQPMFLSFYYCFPLLLIAVEHYLLKKNLILIYFSAFLLTLINYYLVYSASIFLVLYWTLRYFLYHKTSIIQFIKTTFMAVFIYCLGMFSAGFILIPVISFMFSNTRVATKNFSLFFQNPKAYLNILVSLFSSPSGLSGNKVLFSSGIYSLDQVALFSSTLTLLYLRPWFKALNSFEKKLVSGIGVLFGLILFTYFGNSMMHGFSEANFRWVFTLSTLLIILSALGFDKHCLSLKDGIFGLSMIVLVLALSFIALGKIVLNIHIYFIFFSLLTMSLYMFVKNKKNIFLIVLLELIPIYLYCLLTNPLNINSVRFEHNHNLNHPSLELLNPKNSFFRVDFSIYHSDIDFKKAFSYNTGLYYNLKTTMGYESTFHPALTEFNRLNNQYFWWFHLDNYNAQRLVNTRYYIVKDKNELPKENMAYQGRFLDSSFMIYEDLDYIPFGASYDCVMTTQKAYEVYDNYSLLHKMNECLMIKDNSPLLKKDIQNGPKSFLQLDKVSNGYLKGHISLTSNQVIYLSIPYDSGWQAVIDNQKTDIHRVNTNFMGIYLTKGNHQVELKFTPKGYKKGVVVSFICISIFILVYFKKEFLINKLGLKQYE